MTSKALTLTEAQMKRFKEIQAETEKLYGGRVNWYTYKFKSQEERDALWQKTKKEIDELPDDPLAVIEEKMKSNPERVTTKKTKSGEMYRYVFSLNGFGCELEVFNFTNGKDRRAWYWAYNPFEPVAYKRDLVVGYDL